MKILIIGHNALSENNNMGKTLLSYFMGSDPNEIAEFYIQDKDPCNASVANRYYRITDKEALKSLFGYKVGKSFYLENSMPETVANTKGKSEFIRQYGRKRNALVYIVRNLIWSLSHWRNKKLINWLHSFDPDVIFFMAGDYSFMYKIAIAIKELLNKPMVVCCVDDFFFYNRNENTLLGRLQYNSYMKIVFKAMNMSSCILTISDSMREAYHNLFNKPCFTLHTSAIKRHTDKKHGKRIAYFGNLGYRRYEQLLDIGKTVKLLGINGINGIDVYSGERNPDILVGLTEENGIYFHGEISSDKVSQVMDDCMAIIHTESFDNDIQKMIKYSISTKIADSLMNGPCLIAYGPKGIASIDYLEKNKAAYVITSVKDLEKGMREIISDEELRRQIVCNARNLANQNHKIEINPLKVKQWLKMAIDDSFN